MIGWLVVLVVFGAGFYYMGWKDKESGQMFGIIKKAWNWLFKTLSE